MVLRVDVYTGLIYQQLVDERKLKAADGLPPVLPIILFNGESHWNAATSLRDLIRLPEGSSLWNLQPEMGYYVINEVAYPKEVLEGSPYLTAIIFRMGAPRQPGRHGACSPGCGGVVRETPRWPAGKIIVY